MSHRNNTFNIIFRCVRFLVAFSGFTAVVVVVGVCYNAFFTIYSGGNWKTEYYSHQKLMDNSGTDTYIGWTSEPKQRINKLHTINYSKIHFLARRRIVNKRQRQILLYYLHIPSWMRIETHSYLLQVMAIWWNGARVKQKMDKNKWLFHLAYRTLSFFAILLTLAVCYTSLATPGCF